MSTPTHKPLHRLEFYRSGIRRQWRWRYRHGNGNILADSGESYARRIDAMKGARTVTGVPLVIRKDPDLLHQTFVLWDRRVQVVEVKR